MKCEKCGHEFEKLNVLTFARDGSDYEDKCEAEVCDDEAVVVETSKNWCGYELTEEDSAGHYCTVPLLYMPLQKILLPV